MVVANTKPQSTNTKVKLKWDKKFNFFPLNEDKMMFIVWVFLIYIAGAMVTINIILSIFIFLIMGTALLNNVGHLIRETKEEEAEI
jgi:fatty acid desaturase